MDQRLGPIARPVLGLYVFLLQNQGLMYRNQ